MLEFANGANIQIIESAGFIDSASDAHRYIPVAVAQGSEIVPQVAGALQLTNLGAEYTTGNSPLHIRVVYRILTYAI